MLHSGSGKVVLALGCVLVAWAVDCARAEGGRDLFVRHCAACHGVDGRAQTPAARKLGVKDLTKSQVSDAGIEKQILEGKKDQRGSQKMPPFKDKLSRDELRLLVLWVKSLRK